MLQHFNISDVLQRRDYFNGMQVYRCMNDIAPMYMSNFLHLNSEYNYYARILPDMLMSMHCMFQ